MCSISGVWSLVQADIEPVLAEMNQLQYHRGPDGEGVAVMGLGPMMGLASRRLAILDPSAAGHMPMVDDTGRFTIIHNGEIYNHTELRKELRELGHTFNSETDTEVILNAFIHWGRACLDRFNGMWAFAIWDDHEKRLFCARDRFGVKPFYYYRSSDLFVFASEIKALFAHPDVPREPNDPIIYDYLTLRLCDHTDETFFQDVMRLPAGACAEIDLDGNFAIEQWYDATNDVSDETMGDVTAVVQDFQATLEDAVRLRLRSDVALGTCLSGGLDSSSIAATVNRLMFLEHAVDPAVIGEHQKTFSVCYPGAAFDETPFIDAMVERTAADARRTTPTADQLWSDLENFIWHMDEPIQSASQYSQWCVFRLVAEAGVKVTLDGQGADEMLAGYPGYYGALLTSRIASGKGLTALREARAMTALGGPERAPAQLLLRSVYGLVPRWVQMSVRDHAGPLTNLLPEGRTLDVLQPRFRDSHRDRRTAQLRRQGALLKRFDERLKADLLQYSLPALLRYGDRSSMAFSVESRTPFLDYRLVELAHSLPADMKIRDGWTKWILREAMADQIPEDIRWRRDKKGFVTPEIGWLRAGRARIRALFQDGKTRSAHYLDPAAVLAMLDKALDAASPSGAATDVWRWVNLEVWFRTMFPAEVHDDL